MSEITKIRDKRERQINKQTNKKKQKDAKEWRKL